MSVLAADRSSSELQAGADLSSMKRRMPQKPMGIARHSSQSAYLVPLRAVFRQLVPTGRLIERTPEAEDVSFCELCVILVHYVT